MKIVTIEEINKYDDQAIHRYSIPEEVLMENAGLAAYQVIKKEFGITGKRFAVFCGAGNNGGDGLVVARQIFSGGGIPFIYFLSSPGQFKGAARRNFQMADQMKISCQQIKDTQNLSKELNTFDAIVDGIFGTGLNRPIEGLCHDVIQLINQSQKIVFSLDIPSGINGNNGQIMNIAIQANFTVTFGLPKIGNLLFPGFANSGNIYLGNISYPPDLLNDPSINQQINTPPPLPPRCPWGHKNDFGNVLVIAGAANYLGAPYFSAMSFLKSGGGYVRLAVPRSIASHIGNRGSEIILEPMVETAEGSLSMTSLDSIIELTTQADMVIIGPGLSLQPETQELIKQLIVNIDKPLIIDGDGLTALAQDIKIICKRQYPIILTPHWGEMARLCQQEINAIKLNPLQIIKDLSSRTEACVVLKGAHSLISTPSSAIHINLSGNSGMATAGSGDVLTGTIAAMFGLGLGLENSVKTGVFLHGLAGDLAASEKGEDDITATDIMDNLPKAVTLYRKDYCTLIASYGQKINLL